MHRRILESRDAEGGNRTHTPRREPDFESGASASSATSAQRPMVRGESCVRTPRAGTRSRLRPAAPDRILPRSNTVGANGRRRRKRETKRQGSWRDRAVRGARDRSRGLRRRRREREQQQTAAEAAATCRRSPRRRARASTTRGTATPDFIVASDLPLQGAGRAQTTEMVQAIKFALKQRDFKAGDYKIGYQSCDDSTAQAGAWDSAKCASNASCVRREQERHRSCRNVQLRVRQDHRPDPQPGEPRAGRDGQPGEHEPGPHDGRAGRRGRRAGQVLPDGQAELRPRRRERPDPGPGRRAVREGLRGSRRSTSSTTSRRTASASPRRSAALRRSSA